MRSPSFQEPGGCRGALEAFRALDRNPRPPTDVYDGPDGGPLMR